MMGDAILQSFGNGILTTLVIATVVHASLTVADRRHLLQQMKWLLWVHGGSKRMQPMLLTSSISVATTFFRIRTS